MRHSPLILLATGLALAAEPSATSVSKPASATVATAQASTLVADVDGIVCAFCVQGIQKILKKTGKTQEIVISLELKKVLVTEQPGQTLSEAEFRESIRKAGFQAQTFTRVQKPLKETQTELAALASLKQGKLVSAKKVQLKGE